MRQKQPQLHRRSGGDRPQHADTHSTVKLVKDIAECRYILLDYCPEANDQQPDQNTHQKLTTSLCRKSPLR